MLFFLAHSAPSDDITKRSGIEAAFGPFKRFSSKATSILPPSFVLIFQLVLDLMQEFDIDTERLPLGQLSKEQVQRGYDVLERLRVAINNGGESLERLSSEFYQVSLSRCVCDTKVLPCSVHANSHLTLVSSSCLFRLLCMQFQAENKQ